MLCWSLVAMLSSRILFLKQLKPTGSVAGPPPGGSSGWRWRWLTLAGRWRWLVLARRGGGLGLALLLSFFLAFLFPYFPLHCGAVGGGSGTRFRVGLGRPALERQRQCHRPRLSAQSSYVTIRPHTLAYVR